MKINYDELVSYVLMNKNTPVLQFWYDEEVHSVVKISEIFSEKHAPIGIVDFKSGVSRKLFNDWWKARAIPASRENFSKIMQQLNITSSVELLEKCSGLSLSDQYWIKRADSNVEWKDVNFFNNDFSEDIGKLLLGQSEVHLNLDQVSPDNASDGNLPKKWKVINGERYLIKGGNSHNNQEPYNEIIATRLFERILDPGEYVPYFLIEDEGKKYSACKTMVTTDEELVSALAIDSISKLRGSESPYNHFLDACNTLGITNAEVMIAKMLTCDYILANYDRHYRNFGAIRNVVTLEWKGFAPLYDTGSSLWAKFNTNDITDKYVSWPFRNKPKEQLYLVSDLSWLDPDKLIGFDKEVASVLTSNPNMDERRVSVISNKVQQRINEVLYRKKELENDKNVPLDSVIKDCESQKKQIMDGKSTSRGIVDCDREFE